MPPADSSKFTDSGEFVQVTALSVLDYTFATTDLRIFCGDVGG